MTQWIGFLPLWLVIQLFRFLPFRVMYILSDGLAFLLYRVIGYRKKVVFDNLRRALPGKTDEELRRIAWRSYQNLTDVTLETIKAFTMSTAELHRRCPCVNPELVNQYLDRGTSVLISGSHYNNWEYTGQTVPPGLHGPTFAVYKPLTNKVMNRYINRNRERRGTTMVSMHDAFGVMRKRKDEPSGGWLMLADQSPSSRKSAHWVSFLGQDSASLPGVDVMARKFGYPVLYFDIQRIRRGFYEVHYVVLCPDPSKVGEADITRAYAAYLEQTILKQPENWLWSHKRWKIKRETVEVGR